jgi:hypothetical protein
LTGAGCTPDTCATTLAATAFVKGQGQSQEMYIPENQDRTSFFFLELEMFGFHFYFLKSIGE